MSLSSEYEVCLGGSNDVNRIDDTLTRAMEALSLSGPTKSLYESRLFTVNEISKLVSMYSTQVTNLIKNNPEWKGSHYTINKREQANILLRTKAFSHNEIANIMYVEKN